VPAHLAARLNEPRLSLGQLGRLADERLGGGMLLVRLSSGGAFTSDAARASKYDPAGPDDAVVFENTIHWWWLRDLVAHWRANPRDTPAVVAGLADPTSRHYIAGAVRIDWEATWDPGNDPDYEVPTAAGSDFAIHVDTCQLRGRLVDGALFSNVKQGTPLGGRERGSSIRPSQVVIGPGIAVCREGRPPASPRQ